MRTQYLAAIAIAAVAAGATSAAYSVRISDYCPRPSAASVTALFAPCQAFDVAMATGPAITRDEAIYMGLLPLTAAPASALAQEPAPTPAQLVADDFQIMAQEHATVGVANSRREH
jgi:hypothetical protein